jgi:hypothetical protein
MYAERGLVKAWDQGDDYLFSSQCAREGSTPASCLREMGQASHLKQPPAQGQEGGCQWMLVKCLPLEIDDYHHGCSQVWAWPVKQNQEAKY